MAARMIYAGIFERYPDFPFVLAHTGAALIMLMERLDNAATASFPTAASTSTNCRASTASGSITTPARSAQAR